jgi:hypothetical protein
MHFDDRLATVLQHRAAGERAARVQFRQLLDLLGQTQGGTDRSLARAAYRRLDALGLQLSLAERERLAGECSPRIRNPQLLAWFAAAEPRVALAALARAALTEEQWLALIPELPIRARGLLRHRRTLPRSALKLLDRLGVRDRVLPEPQVSENHLSAPEVDEAEPVAPALDLGRFADEPYVIEPRPAAASEPGPTGANAIPGAGNLGDLVRRIEAFQRARQHRATEPVRHDAPRLPLPGEDEEMGACQPLAAFHFTTDDTGRIDWAEGASAPLVVGTRLAAPNANDSDFAAAFAARRPVSGVAKELAGAEAIGGRWIVDAAPRFAPVTGRFTGYVGRFRRPAPAPADTAASLAADRVRQLLHELRTPVTAIQGFAEVIQQQTVGAVPHEYRALAAGIASEAARMLAGFAEIERIAELESGTASEDEGTTDFVAIARRQVGQLATVLSPRVSRIEAHFELEAASVPLSSESAEAIAWRLLGTIASATAAGENMALRLAAEGTKLRLIAKLPLALAQIDDVFASDLHPVGGALGTGLLGAGFALRLARAEARAAGGNLTRDAAGAMVLTLPFGEARLSTDPSTHGGAKSVTPEARPAPLAQSPRLG